MKYLEAIYFQTELAMFEAIYKFQTVMLICKFL